MGRFFGSKNDRVLDPPFLADGAFDVPVKPQDLRWALDTPGLTTQYKSFYFTFEDGSAGYIQYAYGNLGTLVKVAPMGYSYYRDGYDPVVASHTLRAGQMKVSKDAYSVDIGSHAVKMHDDHGGWKAIISDHSLSYDLDFRIESDTFTTHDFGRDTTSEQMCHKIVPHLTVSGTVKAHGEEYSVAGHGSYIEAFFMHVKFTDSCNSFLNFQLRSPDSLEILTFLQFHPRYATQSGPRIAQGSYTKNNKVVSVNFDCTATLTGDSKHSASGYDLPKHCEYSWKGKTLDGAPFSASCQVELGSPISITDVLAIFPKFFKDIVSIWAGSPYVFCYRVPSVSAQVEVDGTIHSFTGMSNTELTVVRAVNV